MNDETVSVDVRLLDFERTCIGNVRAFAAVEIEVEGIVFILQGLTVVQTKREISVELPTFARDGRRLPSFVLPEELIEPVGRIVLEQYRTL